MIKKNEGAIKHLLPRFKVVFITVKLKLMKNLEM